MSKRVNNRIAWSAIIVMSSLIVSRITGFLREMLVVNCFSDSLLTDGYNYAFTITDFFYYLLLGGSIASALIPVMTQYISGGKEQEQRGWVGTSAFINVFMCILLVVCGLGMVFSRQILDLWFPQYALNSSNPEYYRNIVATLIRILFPSVACMMVTGFMNGILNSYKRFAAAAYGPTIYNIGCCIAIFAFRGNIINVALGVLASSFAYMCIQIAFTSRHLKNYTFTFDIHHEAFISLLTLAIPTLISSALVQLNVVVTKTFTQFYDAGAVTALNDANNLWQMPYGIFAAGIGTAMLPSISEYFAKGENSLFKDTMRSSIRYVLFLVIPSAFAFVALSDQLAASVFLWSNNVSDSLIFDIGILLRCMAFCMVFQSVDYLCYRAFYASHNTKTPLLLSFINVLLTTVFGTMIVRFTDWDVVAIGYMYAAASLLTCIVTCVLTYTKLGDFGYKNILHGAVKMTICAVIMSAAVYSLSTVLDVNIIPQMFSLSSKIIDLIKVLGMVIAGVLVYFAGSVLFKIEETSKVLDTVKSKIGIKLQRNS